MTCKSVKEANVRDTLHSPPCPAESHPCRQLICTIIRSLALHLLLNAAKATNGECIFSGKRVKQCIAQVLPHDGEPATVVMYGVTMVICGLLKSWAAPACNNPVFAEIVPAHLRTLVYSFDRCPSCSPMSVT